MFSEEELEALLRMGDISGAEQSIARQRALSEQLRGAPFMSKTGRDWGSNLGRAGGGIAAALGDYRAGQQQKELTPMKQQILAQLAEALRKRRNPAIATPATLPEVPQGQELY